MSIKSVFNLPVESFSNLHFPIIVKFLMKLFYCLYLKVVVCFLQYSFDSIYAHCQDIYIVESLVGWLIFLVIKIWIIRRLANHHFLLIIWETNHPYMLKVHFDTSSYYIFFHTRLFLPLFTPLFSLLFATLLLPFFSIYFIIYFLTFSLLCLQYSINFFLEATFFH